MIRADKRRTPALLAAATLIPIVVLSSLGWRVLQQDREIERQRQREALKIAAERAAINIERHLQSIEQRLANGAGLRFTPAGITPGADGPLLFQPMPAVPQEPPPEVFAAAEADEFGRDSLPRAAAAYRTLAQTSDPGIRAAALLRLGRVLRKTGDFTGATRAYLELTKLGTVLVAGEPAGLIARQGLCKTLQEKPDTHGLQREAAALAHAIGAGGWKIDQATFQNYREMLSLWGAAPALDEPLARTESAVELWLGWRRGGLPPRGRRLMRTASLPVLAVWSGGPERPSAWLIAQPAFGAMLRESGVPGELAVSLLDLDRRPLYGISATAAVSLLPGETGLPFVVAVASPQATTGGLRGQRTILVAGLVAAFALMIAAGYGLYRATTRELMLARQQSDFVSAVSHEFRTPLTSMRHLTHLLVSRGITSDARKTQYYELLASETERLHRMVESLLSFGRIEAGAYAWRLEPVDSAALVGGIVAGFRCQPQAAGREIACEIEDNLPFIQADSEALTRAIENLLENALKYSEPPAPVRVFARTEGSSVLLGVEDMGIGIAAGERDRIFLKFVRGAGAKQAGIRGVGIGLTLVKRIVEAHGGSIHLESVPGQGSRFTLVLPCLES